MDKRQNRYAYFYLLPAISVVLVSAIIPLMTVVNYSVQDSFAGGNFFWMGTHWFESVLGSHQFYGALVRSLSFSALVLLIQVPLGIYIAVHFPAKGFLSALYLVLIAIPLLTPWLVVGYIWKVLVMPNAGLLGAAAGALGIPYDMNNPVVVWLTLAAMDSWHWTSLVVLLCFAGLRAIPHAYYQAAQIDGASRWAVFWYVQLPRLRLVLLIAILLRFMDSFMIYTEAYVVTRGGPGVSTTFLSHELVQTATVQFDLGEGGAISIIYFLIVLCVSWAFFSLIRPRDRAQSKGYS